MLAEVVRVPRPDDDPEQNMAALLEVAQSEGEEEAGSISYQLDEVQRVLNAFQEFLGSASYPDVVVSPIAVYREITPEPEA